jgi:hypothetical protein
MCVCQDTFLREMLRECVFVCVCSLLSVEIIYLVRDSEEN